MTITDRLTKMVQIIPTQTNATAKDIAHLFIRHVIRHHGIPTMQKKIFISCLFVSQLKALLTLYYFF